MKGRSLKWKEDPIYIWKDDPKNEMKILKIKGLL